MESIWQVMYMMKYWRGEIWQMYAYQSFGGNELANHLCSTFRIFQRQSLVRLNLVNWLPFTNILPLQYFTPDPSNILPLKYLPLQYFTVYSTVAICKIMHVYNFTSTCLMHIQIWIACGSASFHRIYIRM